MWYQYTVLLQILVLAVSCESKINVQNFILIWVGAFEPLLRIGIRIRMFLGVLDPDPLVRGMDSDPDPSITKQK